MHVGHTNPHFQREILEACQRFRHANPGAPLPKHWQAHFRVIGLKARTFSGNVAKRGGALLLRPLPFKLVPPAASPPIQSTEEILASGVSSACTAMVSRRGKASARLAEFVFFFFFFPVVHSKHQFTKKNKVLQKPGVTLAGTQAIDRWWQSLDCFLPNSLNNRDWKTGGLKNTLLKYVHAFLWRYHPPSRR